MKKIIISVILLALVVGGGYAILQSKHNSLGAGYTSTGVDLVGSSANLKSLPRTYVFASATTTDESNSFAAGAQVGYLDGGSTITQRYPTEGVDKVRLNIEALGGTATSTLGIIQQISHDDTNWFDIQASSTASSLAGNATTTLSVGPFVVGFDPGTSTITKSMLFDTFGARYTRFVFMAEDKTTDPNDGVQAWIQAVFIQPQ